jgi:hypothetical protein
MNADDEDRYEEGSKMDIQNHSDSHVSSPLPLRHAGGATLHLRLTFLIPLSALSILAATPARFRFLSLPSALVICPRICVHPRLTDRRFIELIFAVHSGDVLSPFQPICQSSSAKRFRKIRARREDFAGLRLRRAKKSADDSFRTHPNAQIRTGCLN